MGIPQQQLLQAALQKTTQQPIPLANRQKFTSASMTPQGNAGFVPPQMPQMLNYQRNTNGLNGTPQAQMQSWKPATPPVQIQTINQTPLQPQQLGTALRQGMSKGIRQEYFE